MIRLGQQALFAAAVACTATACKEPQSDRPYTPFGVVSVAEPPRPPPTANTTPGEFAVQKAVLAPLGAKQWLLGGRTLRSVGSLVFEQALEADFDNDGSVETVAWLTTDPSSLKPTGAATKPPGELWLYPASSTTANANTNPSKLFDAPGFLPVLGCKPQTDLTRTGPQTVTVQIAMSCERPVTGRMPIASLSVVAPRRETPHVLTLRVARSTPDAARGPDEIALEIFTLDRDHDGRDDIELKAQLADPSGQAADDKAPAQLSFIWLDRKAGLSRETLFPAKNFRDVAVIELLRATGKNTSLKTLARIETMRKLFSALCAESHVPTVFDQDNNPLACSLGPDTLGSYATAEVRSFLTQKQWGNAVSALLRTNWYGGPIPEKTKSDLTAEVEKAIPVKVAHALGHAGTKAREVSSIPHFSPLAFDAEGLLIQHAEGVLRLDLDTFEENDASEEVDPWPLTVISPTGERLMGIAYPCDRPTVTLLASTDSGAAAPIATSILAPRPGICGGTSMAFSELPLRPVSWGKAGLRVLLAGSEIGPATSESIALGSARSENGEHSVIATELGLLLLHKSNAELWRVEGTTTNRLQDCVVDNSAAHVACLDRGRARVFGNAAAVNVPSAAPSSSPSATPAVAQPTRPADPQPEPPAPASPPNP